MKRLCPALDYYIPIEDCKGCEEGCDNKAVDLVDIEKCPFYMRGDYEIRNKNIIAEKELCKRCDGTGNELYSMYKQCEACYGTGIKNNLVRS